MLERYKYTCVIVISGTKNYIGALRGCPESLQVCLPPRSRPDLRLRGDDRVGLLGLCNATFCFVRAAFAGVRGGVWTDCSADLDRLGRNSGSSSSSRGLFRLPFETL